MKYIIGLLLVLLSFSCSKKTVPAKTEIRVKDSTVTKIVTVLRDTTIYIHDSIKVSVQTGCPEVKPISAKSKDGLEVTTGIDNKGVLYADCKADSLKAVITWLEKQLQLESYKKVEVKESVPVEVVKVKNVIPKWIWYLLAILVAGNLWGYRESIVKVIGLIK